MSGKKNKPQVRQSEAPPRRPDGTMLPGHTANPGGQPKWVKAVRDALETIVSDKAIKLLDQVIGGEAIDVKIEGVDVKMTPQMADRLRAVDIALSYSLAKPKQQLELSGDPERPLEVVNLKKLSDVEAVALRETMRKLKSSD